jgi:hypothetical protein
VLIVGSFIIHFDHIDDVAREAMTGTRDSLHVIGILPTLYLFLRAYSMGAGTYTGIEAVSNGLPVLREPRVRTGKRTMLYMAISLAVTAGGILIGYQLFGIRQEPGRTLNASLLHNFADGWNTPAFPFGKAFVLLALLSEGALLFVAAQTGFVDGPRVLSSMAVDRWVPNRFANLSSRLVTRNGIMWMGLAAAAALVYTHAAVEHLVLMYSINVFVTFTLSQLGMVRHWWQERRTHRGWWPRLLLNGTGMLISGGILIVTVALKFFQGGWVTVVITGSVIGLAFLVRRHYRRVSHALTMLNLLVEPPASSEAATSKHRRVAAIFVNRYDGLGLHTLERLRSILGRDLRKIVFLSVAQVDSDHFKNEEQVQQLVEERKKDLERYEAVAREAGLETESRYAIGTDVVEELVQLALAAAEREPDAIFIAGQVVFQRENLSTRMLHNEVAFALQRRLIFRGLDMLILPVRVPEEIW